MTLKIFDCEQRSEAWFRARMGMPTASMFSVVMSMARDPDAISSRKRYLHNLASEIITGEPVQHYSNKHMDRGSEMEPEARSHFALLNDETLTTIGYATNDGLVKGRTIGGSPDALIGDKGVLEIKTQEPHLLIDKLINLASPTEHMAQCQGNIWVMEREFCKIGFYWPGLPMYERRIKRDDTYIKKMEIALEVFFEELDETVAKVKAYGRGVR